MTVCGLPVAVGPALNRRQTELKYLLLVDIVFLEKVVGGAQVHIWNTSVNKSSVKWNSKTSAEVALDLSYRLFEEVHCWIEVVQFDILPPPPPVGKIVNQESQVLNAL